MLDIEQVLGMIGDWRDKKIEYAPLGGGITNHNYKVTIDGEIFMVRIPGEGSDLFIDRENELACSVQAGKTGVSPEVVYHIDEENVSVFRFISGKTLTTEQIAGSDRLIGRIVRAVRTVHREALFPSTFNPFETVRRYMGFVEKYEVPLPEDMDWMIGVGDEIECAMKRNKPEDVACHNDYLSENFMDDLGPGPAHRQFDGSRFSLQLESHALDPGDVLFDVIEDGPQILWSTTCTYPVLRYHPGSVKYRTELF